jgi:subtilisin family serine protease
MSAQGYEDNARWDDAIESSPDIVVGGLRSRQGRPSAEVLYRPRQVLVDTGVYEGPARDPDEQAVRDLLDDAGATSRNDEPAAVARRLGLTLLDTDADAEGLVRRSREFVPRAVGLNSVLIACPQRHGGCSPPQPVAASVDIPGAGDAGRGITIAVLDTGIVDPPPFDVDARPEDIEPLDELPPGTFGPAVGHGTMVAGVIARYAPGARLVIRKVLRTPLGEADELEIARALLELPAGVDILNASFGGFYVDDTSMLALERAVNALPRETLVVASAGNEGLRRPEFVAAFKRVIGVAAVERGAAGFALPDYTNRGFWVDCCADGTGVESTFVTGSPSSGSPAFTGRARASGTSFAAPKVAARAADVASRYGIGVRLAAQLLLDDRAHPVVEEGGTVVE